MKQIVLLLLLIGGGIVGAQAQHRGNGYGHDKHYRVHRGGNWDDCNRHYRGAYYNCRPAVPVVYAQPAPVIYAEPAPVVYAQPAPVYVPAPPPPPRVVYQRSPRVVIATGPIVIGL
ncbi:hypothetical protein [Chitinophaga tropicalis]|uniref:PXPV repeat-containing protein n=1 Tax=Chitinophaga tropicalis TaxID=2683588 RepID=A0A7K1UCR4_9BACT|nr:hypothetical protein [Chitinophaga tropicalis]MVT12167.1 hypothetical protein [Chitinophaga tropicalis]